MDRERRSRVAVTGDAAWLESDLCAFRPRSGDRSLDAGLRALDDSDAVLEHAPAACPSVSIVVRVWLSRSSLEARQGVRRNHRLSCTWRTAARPFAPHGSSSRSCGGRVPMRLAVWRSTWDVPPRAA